MAAQPTSVRQASLLTLANPNGVPAATMPVATNGLTHSNGICNIYPTNLPHCGCKCGSCTIIHYLPIPKTASEATKTHLGASELATTWGLRTVHGELVRSQVSVAPGVAPCGNRTFCFISGGTHVQNIHRPPTADGPSLPLASSPTWWREAHHPKRCDDAGYSRLEDYTNLLRIATVRNPYERFLSSFAVDEREGRLKPFGVRQRRPTQPFDISSALSVLRNDSAMVRLLSDGNEHFTPAHAFIVGDRGEARAHILLRYAHLEDDLNDALRVLRSRAPRANLPRVSPSWPSLNFSRRVNDQERGEHDYMRQLDAQPEVMALIERWYRRDFEALGFAQRSRGGRVDPSIVWVGRACAPVTATETSDPPAFDVTNWPAPLVCRTLPPADLKNLAYTVLRK